MTAEKGCKFIDLSFRLDDYNNKIFYTLFASNISVCFVSTHNIAINFNKSKESNKDNHEHKVIRFQLNTTDCFCLRVDLCSLEGYSQ